MDLFNDFEVEFKIGDLVMFVSYNYTPDFYYDQEDFNNSMGIVVGIDYYGDYMSQPWIYEIFWFNTSRCAKVDVGHLRIISQPPT